MHVIDPSIDTVAAGSFVLVEGFASGAAGWSTFRNSAGVYVFALQTRWVVGYPTGFAPEGFVGLPAYGISFSAGTHCEYTHTAQGLARA